MLIGLGGASRAGKTTLAGLLSDHLSKSGVNVIIVHQDQHVVSEDELPLIRDKRDWEVPSSIDWASLYAAVRLSLDIADIVIVEGLFCYSEPRLNVMMDVKLFVNIDKELFVSRKKEDLRWGSEPEPDWYIEHIWLSFLKYGLPLGITIDHYLDGSVFFDVEGIVAAVMK